VPDPLVRRITCALCFSRAATDAGRRPVKPPPFEHHVVGSIDEATRALAEFGDEAKVLAGGQSLMPLLNLRLTHPTHLVDINRVAELEGISNGDGLRLAAVTRHRTAERSPVLQAANPLLVDAIRWIGHAAIRNRGTIGGSLAHSDPAAELPLLLVTLGGSVEVRSVGGARTIAAEDLFDGFLTTTLEPDELLTSAYFPALERGTGWSFQEFNRRSGDFGIVSAAVTLQLTDGLCRGARIGLAGVSGTPIRLPESESALDGERPTAALFEEVALAAVAPLEPPNDLHGTPAYRRHLAATLLKRALQEAFERAEHQA
jgi:aerobic carbon-monoxide dehydrogenase medium subunit